MRTITEPLCNLTLTRNEWAILVSLLDDVHGELSRSVRMAIRTALNTDLESDVVSLERDVEKWKTVLQLVIKVPKSFRREANAVVHSMTCQVSKAEFTRSER